MYKKLRIRPSRKSFQEELHRRDTSASTYLSILRLPKNHGRQPASQPANLVIENNTTSPWLEKTRQTHTHAEMLFPLVLNQHRKRYLFELLLRVHRRGLSANIRAFNITGRLTHPLQLLTENVGLHVRSNKGAQSYGAGMILVVPGYHNITDTHMPEGR